MSSDNSNAAGSANRPSTNQTGLRPPLAGPGHAAGEPRLYRQPVSLTWWLRKPSYLIFVLRELSSVFLAWFVVYLLMLVYAVSSGSAAYQDFLDLSANPAMVILNVIALAFVVLHTVTWFGLAPKAMVIRLGAWRVPPSLILAGHYGALLVVSAIVAWVILR